MGLYIHWGKGNEYKCLLKNFYMKNIEKVSIDYSMKDVNNTVGIKILSKDGKKEFRAEVVLLIDDSAEIGGKKYNIHEFIKALNTSFNKKNY